MKSFLSNYSNGWGHVIITVAFLIFVAIVLIFADYDKDLTTLMVSVITLMIGYWFGSSKAMYDQRPTSTQEKASFSQEEKVTEP